MAQNFATPGDLPWDGTIQGFLAPKSDQEALRTSVLFAVLTRLGERVMRPTLGSHLPTTPFELNNEATKIRVQQSVEDAIRTYEPRAEFLGMDITQDENTLTGVIRFKNKLDPTGEEVVSVPLAPQPILKTAR